MANGGGLEPQLNTSIITQGHDCLSVKVLLNFGPTVASDPHPPKQMITVGTCNSSQIKKVGCSLNID